MYNLSFIVFFTRLDLLQPSTRQGCASQYLVLALRLVAFMRFDIGTRSAVARKHLLYVGMFSHASMRNAFHFPPCPPKKGGPKSGVL